MVPQLGFKPFRAWDLYQYYFELFYRHVLLHHSKHIWKLPVCLISMVSPGPVEETNVTTSNNLRTVRNHHYLILKTRARSFEKFFSSNIHLQILISNADLCFFGPATKLGLLTGFRGSVTLPTYCGNIQWDILVWRVNHEFLLSFLGLFRLVFLPLYASQHVLTVDVSYTMKIH